MNHNKEKSEFILYNTMNLLLDTIPSLEEIEKAVILHESAISSRMTEHASKLDQLNLQRPHSLGAEELIAHSFNPTWNAWSELAGKLEGQ